MTIPIDLDISKMLNDIVPFPENEVASSMCCLICLSGKLPDWVMETDNSSTYVEELIRCLISPSISP